MNLYMYSKYHSINSGVVHVQAATATSAWRSGVLEVKLLVYSTNREAAQCPDYGMNSKSAVP